MDLSNLDKKLILQRKYMYEKKKILVKKAFEQAKKELKKENASKNYVAEYLNTHFEDLFGSAKTEKMFERYYTDLVQKNEDRYIDDITQDQLSKYIGYRDYDDFCKNYVFTNKINDSTTLKFTIDDEEHSFTGKSGSNFSFTLFNSPVFNIPEFLTKQSNLGIVAVILCGSLIVGSKMYKAEDYSSKVLGIFDNSKQCMFWNGKEYIPEDCNNTRNGLVAIDLKLIDNFKKITTPDTIKSVKGIWYSKYDNEVELFTSDGKNPENGKELHPLTTRMLNKYILAEN